MKVNDDNNNLMKAFLTQSFKQGMNILDKEYETAKKRQTHIENFTKHNREVSGKTKRQSFMHLVTAIIQCGAGTAGVGLGIPTDNFLRSFKIDPTLVQNIQHFCQSNAPKIIETFSQMASMREESFKILSSGKKDIENIEINEESSNKQLTAQNLKDLATRINQLMRLQEIY